MKKANQLTKKKSALEILSVDLSDLTGQMVRHPSDLGAYGRRLAAAKREAAKAKLRLDVIEAELDLSLRLRQSSTSKLTEQAVKMKIRSNKKYITAKEQLAEADYTVDVLDGMAKALHAKTGMLLSLGAADRKILDGEELRILKDRATRKLTKE